MASFDLSLMGQVLSFVDRGVTTMKSFLLLKLAEIKDVQRASFERGLVLTVS